MVRSRVCDQSVTLYPQRIRPACPPVPPLQLISACATQRQPEVRDVVVEPTCGVAGKFRVTAEIIVPIDVCFCDENGNRFNGEDVIIIPQNTLLRLPRNRSYTFGAMARVRITPAGGSCDSPFALRACYDAEVCFYVATIEPCESRDCCQTDSRCDWYFSLPIYPPG